MEMLVLHVGPSHFFCALAGSVRDRSLGVAPRTRWPVREARAPAAASAQSTTGLSKFQPRGLFHGEGLEYASGREAMRG